MITNKFQGTPIIHLFPETVAASVERGEIYLGADNLYYCTKCNSKVSHDMKLGGYMIGICTKCNNVAEINKNDYLKKNRDILEARQRDCFIGKKWQDCTFENDNLSDKNTTVKLRYNYIANFEKYKAESKGLLLFGGVGTGKTFYAYCVLNELLKIGIENEDYEKKGYKAKVIKILSQYNAFLAAKDKQEFINGFLKYDIICIDDLGAERSNDAIIDFMYCLIDTLCEYKKIIICTTNLPYSTISQCSTENGLSRVYSRIIGNTIPLPINKTNKRAESVENIFPVWDAFNKGLKQEGLLND